MELIKSLRLRALAGLVLSIAACGGEGGTESPVAPLPPQEISAAARAYLDEVIGVMQANSLHRLTIDWPQFRRSVFAEAGAAQIVNQTFPAIRTALLLLGDGHSAYYAANGTVLFVPNRTCRLSNTPPHGTIPANIGYVKVGAFSGTFQEALAFTDGIQTTIRLADRDDLIGWIVDLRGNTGGNMWPMLAGLGPVLGEGLLGWFIDPGGSEVSWEYRGGASWSGAVAVMGVDAPYVLKKPNPKVAVLVDNGVASSGEATFIAFRKRANTRSFGMATCGLSTANRALTLSDGALLNLTVSVMADRDKTKYGGQVQPDETIEGSPVDRAITWLQTATQ